MSDPRSTLRAYAELSRLSNLPTCATNVLVGCALGAASGGELSWIAVTTLVAATSLFYVAGMALNDLVDVPIDRVERPSRPIPSGRVSRRGAIGYTTACFGIGLGVVAPLGAPAFLIAVALVLSIVAYDLTHKKTAVSVLLMGLCRGLIYWMSAAAVSWPLNGSLLWIFSAALTLYILILTLVARGENQNRGGGWFRILLLTAAAVSPLAAPERLEWSRIALPLGLLLAWSGYAAVNLQREPPRVKQAILAWLAGLCLIDALYLTLLDRPAWAVAAAACFLLTLRLHRRIAGT